MRTSRWLVAAYAAPTRDGYRPRTMTTTLIFCASRGRGLRRSYP
ncbi:hypothetical protein GLA29479_2166 [Lysobacter antibioticus]|nr:hypothetical protein GLA29479_2166 [Lysobacter antibioticus]